MAMLLDVYKSHTHPSIRSMLKMQFVNIKHIKIRRCMCRSVFCLCCISKKMKLLGFNEKQSIWFVLLCVYLVVILLIIVSYYDPLPSDYTTKQVMNYALHFFDANVGLLILKHFHKHNLQRIYFNITVSISPLSICILNNNKLTSITQG